jgi:hypothetical protein
MVSLASKRQGATLYPAANHPERWSRNDDGTINADGIDTVIEWSKTSHGGKQYDMFKLLESEHSCSSIYGLCE